MSALEVVSPGPFTTVQDAGRPGLADIGVSPSGALDRAALLRANRLLGNRPEAAVLEIAGGGFEAIVRGAVWIVLTGAAGDASVGGRPVDQNAPVLARDGELLSVGVARRGIRFVLGVRGGVGVPPVLGSRSYDALSGLGPPPAVTGDLLPVGEDVAGEVPPLDIRPWDPPPSGTVVVPLLLGPRDGYLADAAVALLLDQEWRVSDESNRVGARLLGRPLERRVSDEIPSEGMVAGAVQVPPSGLPTVLLADHPVTGGYPVVGVVASRGLDAFAQLRPGQGLRFRRA